MTQTATGRRARSGSKAAGTDVPALGLRNALLVLAPALELRARSTRLE